MECHHCGEKFDDKTVFEAHLNHHLKVQQELKRPKDRSYGARYVSAKKKSPSRGSGPSTATSSASALRDSTNRHDVKARDNRASTSQTAIIAMDARSMPRKANWAARTPEAVRGLQKLLDTYPVVPFGPDGPQLNAAMTTASDARCRHCDAVFSARDDLNSHYLSRNCDGVSAIVHLMIYDSSKVGNYRMEMRLIPFEHKGHEDELEFQCRKCEVCFETEAEADDHEKTHPNEDVSCLHCSKRFSTSYELDQHYEFHDDMTFRHRRDRMRAGEPVLAGEDTRSFLDQPGIQRLPMDDAGVERIPRKTGDLIALGFISAEDLEKVHAPNGTFKERSDYYYRIPQHLDPDNDPGSVSFHDGEICVTEGTMVTFSPNKDEGAGAPAKAAVADEKEPPPPYAPPTPTDVSPVEKKSRFRKMLGMSKKPEKPQANSADEKLLQRTSTLTELTAPVTQHTTQANQVKDKRKPYGISIQGHGVPGRMFLTDRSKRTLAMGGGLFADAIYLSIVDNDDGSKARAQAVPLLSSAAASNSRGDLANAASSWTAALKLMQRYPNLDPRGTFELVILWELANCVDAMHDSLNAELLFYRFLAASYARSGRESSNNYNAVNALGVLYDNLGRVQEAAQMYARSIAGRAKVCGPRHHDTAMSLQELGTVYLRLGEYRSARPLYEMSLAGFQENEGPHKNFSLIVSQNLCNVYEELGMRDNLYLLLDQLVARAPQALGLQHLITGAAIRRWIQCHGKAGLPPGIAGYVAQYRAMYAQNQAEVARWVLEVC